MDQEQRSANRPRIKIVLVEDEEVPQEISAKALRQCADAEVFVADNGIDAVSLVKEHRPVLVIQDLRLNTQKSPMNGWDCISEYRKFDDTVKIIVTSANAIAEGEDVGLIKNYAISSILRKPYSIQQFQDEVRKILKETYTYKDFQLAKDVPVNIQVSPHAEKIIHTLDSMLWNTKLKLEKYGLEYKVEELFCDQLSHENFKKQKEVFQKALTLIENSQKEIDAIVQEVEKIKFLK